MHYIPLNYFFHLSLSSFLWLPLFFASHFPYIVYELILFTFIDLFNDDHLTNLYRFFSYTMKVDFSGHLTNFKNRSAVFLYFYHNYTTTPIFSYTSQYILTITENIGCSSSSIAEGYQLVKI
jgi:hypothetical protein